MPQPYDYSTPGVDVEGIFSAYRNAKQARRQSDEDMRQDAVRKYLPDAYKGDQAAIGQVMANDPETGMKLDMHRLAKAKEEQEGIGALLGAVQTRQMTLDQAKDVAVRQFGLAPEKVMSITEQDIPGLIARSKEAQAQIATAFERGMKEKQFGLDESRTRAQNAASYASAAADGRRGAGAVDLTNADKREIFETDELVGANKSAISLLQQARDLSDRSLQGPGAGGVASVTSILGDEHGENTLEFDNLLKQQVLPQLKAIFGGMPTEGERKVLLDLQGSSSLQRSVRNKIIDNALRLADARLRFNQEKATGLRSGAYYNTPPSFEMAAPPGAPQVAPAKPPLVRSQREFDALPSGTIYVEPDGKQYRKEPDGKQDRKP